MTAGATIAAGHPETVQAARTILAAGGNAFDAVVAAGLAASVAEPGLTSLGGGGFLIARSADGATELIDFFVDTPGSGRPPLDEPPPFASVIVRFSGADQLFHAGPASVAVPGCLDGYLSIHRQRGRLPLREVVEPATRLARDGVVLNRQQAEVFRLLEGIFDLTAEGRTLFAPNGVLLTEGDRFHNRPLASFLARLGGGEISGVADATVADPVVALMEREGGVLSREDLARYRVIARQPLELRVGAARILTNPPPSFGGTLVLRALDLLHERGALTPGPTDTLVGPLVEALTTITDEHQASTAPRSAKGTTHISIADADRNVAAMTTSNGSCSGVFVPDTGIQLNNIMGEEDLHPHGLHASPPGQRVGSMMAPTIIEWDDGRVVALGSGGSERIRSALTQVIALLLRGHPLAEAIDAPRIHWDGRTLQVEPGAADHLVDPADATAVTVNRWAAPNLYFGGVHAVSSHGDPHGDLRRGGSTARV
jgi:gamma-glutamyltranspeptidase/glutathione hydrolase